jgi:hypothetical protein
MFEPGFAVGIVDVTSGAHLLLLGTVKRHVAAACQAHQSCHPHCAPLQLLEHRLLCVQQVALCWDPAWQSVGLPTE